MILKCYIILVKIKRKSLYSIIIQFQLMVLYMFGRKRERKVYFFHFLKNLLIEIGLVDTSSDVISLSDWMHESTMFNIITNILFFKNYVICNIFILFNKKIKPKFSIYGNQMSITDFSAKPVLN